jgi:hypothetical protein
MIPIYRWSGTDGISARSKQTGRTYMTDIAPAIAALLHVQMPIECIGQVIDEFSK